MCTPFNLARVKLNVAAETKMWAAVRENGDFFALEVPITGKLLKIDEYMLRDNL